MITGASSGMGRDFARLLDRKKEAEELWLIARREDRLQELAQGLDTPCRIFSLDLKERTSFDLIKLALQQHQAEIRWLISSAGFGKVGTVENIPLKKSEEMIELNIMALTRLSTICLPYFGKGAHIVHLASAAAFLPQPNFAVYAATKSYVLSFSRALGKELKKRQIDVLAVCPGPVKTEFFNIAEETGHFADYKKAFYVESEKVVSKAYYDALKHRSISVYGLPMKLVHAAGKLLPTDFILKFYN